MEVFKSESDSGLSHDLKALRKNPQRQLQWKSRVPGFLLEAVNFRGSSERENAKAPLR